MAKVIIGRKLGMTQFFTEDGARIAVTVIQAGPCPVSQVKSKSDYGYDAVQLAFEEVPDRKISKPERGHLAKHSIAPHRHLHEFRGDFELTAGEVVTVEGFEPGDAIKVSGRSKGKGFAGTIKRHGFSRGPVSHGSHNVRAPGSIGQSATPSRVIKGVRMAGHMGHANITQRGLQVLDRDVERNLLLVSGAVPGPTGGLVFVREDR
jgi:large subunit ribosomal protein L3